MTKKDSDIGYAVSRLVKANYKGFIAGLFVVGVPLIWQDYRTEQQDWHAVDLSVTTLVNTVIDLDAVPSALQPGFTFKPWERMRFVRDFQTENHPDEWQLFAKQIPLIREDSDVSPYNRAIEGHRSIGRRVHGIEQFSNTELRRRTDLIEKSFDGEAFDAPLALLAYVQTANFEQLIPASETDERVKWLLVSERALRRYKDAPRIDLSDPGVIEQLDISGIEITTSSAVIAVPALYALSDSAFEVRPIVIRHQN